MQATYKCPKCNGTGYLARHAGIANGVCFSCEGNGTKTGNPPVPGALFAVSAILKATGERNQPFSLKAKSEAAALKKAIVTLSRGNGYVPDSAKVTRTGGAS